MGATICMLFPMDSLYFTYNFVGVEARAGGVILLRDTEISLCGSQGLASHADAGACIVERFSLFFSNFINPYLNAVFNLSRYLHFRF